MPKAETNSSPTLAVMVTGDTVLGNGTRLEATQPRKVGACSDGKSHKIPQEVLTAAAQEGLFSTESWKSLPT